MSINTERVIEEVRSRPCLWDCGDPNYKERSARIEAWQDVCIAVLESYKDLDPCNKIEVEQWIQQRWKTARDAYIRSIPKQTNVKSGKSSRKKYIYYKQLKFLDQTIIPNAMDNSASKEVPKIVEDAKLDSATSTEHKNTLRTYLYVENQEGNFDEIQASEIPPTDSWNHDTKMPKRTRKRKGLIAHSELEREMLLMLKQNEEDMQNDDMAFFASLIPIINKFSDHKKLLFRREVLKKAMQIIELDQNQVNNLQSGK